MVRTTVLAITRAKLEMTGNMIASGNLNISGIATLNNSTTCVSSLNVSGTTTLDNAATCLSTLNIVGNILGSGTA
jgi:hypothetical protein